MLGSTSVYRDIKRVEGGQAKHLFSLGPPVQQTYMEEAIK